MYQKFIFILAICSSAHAYAKSYVPSSLASSDDYPYTSLQNSASDTLYFVFDLAKPIVIQVNSQKQYFLDPSIVDLINLHIKLFGNANLRVIARERAINEYLLPDNQRLTFSDTLTDREFKWLARKDAFHISISLKKPLESSDNLRAIITAHQSAFENCQFGRCTL